MKNAASRAVVSGVRIIQIAQDMFSFCTEKMITSTSCPHVSSEHSFQLLSSDDIARGPHDALAAVKGTQSIHSCYLIMAREGPETCLVFVIPVFWANPVFVAIEIL